MFSYEEAKRMYLDRFYLGRKKDSPNKIKIFPYSRIYENEKFVSKDIRISTILQIKNVRQDIITEYINLMKTQQMHEVWLSMGRKMKDNSFCPNHNMKFTVFDGNHRIVSTKVIGLSTIRAILPESDYLYYMENLNG